MSVNRWYSVAFAIFALVALIAARFSEVPTWALATLIVLGWLGWFIKIGVEERDGALRERQRTLMAMCRAQWRAQQGGDANALRDWLPLTQERVEEWFARRGEVLPERWDEILATLPD